MKQIQSVLYRFCSQTRSVKNKIFTRVLRTTLFLGATIAPTQEITLIATQIGWIRTVGIGVLSIVVAYVTLFELEFRGEQGRLDRSRRAQVGTALTAYAVGVIVSGGLLTAYGQFIGADVPLIVQKTILLAFPTSLGAAGAEVVV